MIANTQYKAKQFNLSGLNGISDPTLEMHFKLYEGYVKETNRLTEKISEFLTDGKVDQDELRGITSNPTIFEKAIDSSGDYSDQLREQAERQKSVSEIYEVLAVRDIQMAADLLAPIFEKTEGADGFVSLECSPLLAHDTAATIEEVRHLWRVRSNRTTPKGLYGYL